MFAAGPVGGRTATATGGAAGPAAVGRALGGTAAAGVPSKGGRFKLVVRNAAGVMSSLVQATAAHLGAVRGQARTAQGRVGGSHGGSQHGGAAEGQGLKGGVRGAGVGASLLLRGDKER